MDYHYLFQISNVPFIIILKYQIFGILKIGFLDPFCFQKLNILGIFLKLWLIGTIINLICAM
jgi:hypothetical protein